MEIQYLCLGEVAQPCAHVQILMQNKDILDQNNCMCHKLAEVSKSHIYCLAWKFSGANNFNSNPSSFLSPGPGLKTARSPLTTQGSLAFSRLPTHHPPGVNWPSEQPKSSLSILSRTRSSLAKLVANAASACDTGSGNPLP